MRCEDFRPDDLFAQIQVLVGMDAYVSNPIRGRELYAALAPFLGAARDEPVLRLVKG